MAKNTYLSNPSGNDDNVDFVLEPNKATTCQNCESEHDIDFEFCPHCGQKTEEDLTVGVLFYNTIANYFSFDARFFRSFVPLVFRPGLLAKRFVSGKRLMYLHPAQMYLFISVVFFFFFSFKVREYNAKVDKNIKRGFELEQSQDSINLSPIDSSAIAKFKKPFENEGLMSGLSEEERKELDSVFTIASKPQNVKNNLNFGYDTKKLDSLIEAQANEKELLKGFGMKDDAGFFTKFFYKQALKFHKNRGEGLLQTLMDSIPISLFILLPIFAMILKIFYWRRGSFAHHLVFSFYYFSFLFVLMCILLGINYFLDIPDWIDALAVLSTFFYFVFAVRTFYQQGFFISFLKTSMVSFVCLVVLSPIAILVTIGLFSVAY
jgi:rRNA maturation endonuclease Nob1